MQAASLPGTCYRDVTAVTPARCHMADIQLWQNGRMPVRAPRTIHLAARYEIDSISVIGDGLRAIVCVCANGVTYAARAARTARPVQIKARWGESSQDQ